jgi:CBS domain-containing protein
MKIAEICSSPPRYIHRDVRVVEAARRMRDDHVGDLVVVNERRVPVGMLTDRDVVVGILAKDAKHLDHLDVGDVMSDTLVTATGDEDLQPVLKRMRSFGVRRVPVVDEQGVITGVLSIDDVIAALAGEIAEVARLVSVQALREATRRP